MIGPVETEQAIQKFAAPGAYEPIDPENLTYPDLERDIFKFTGPR